MIFNNSKKRCFFQNVTFPVEMTPQVPLVVRTLLWGDPQGVDIVALGDSLPVLVPH